MASQSTGIQQLLHAEKKAADKVSEARKRKNYTALQLVSCSARHQCKECNLCRKNSNSNWHDFPKNHNLFIMFSFISLYSLYIIEKKCS
jgi:hypothetical protein